MKNYLEKTLNYLASERGKLNWSLNVSRGYTPEMNLCAAVQTATRLIKYERIIAVMDAIILIRR